MDDASVIPFPKRRSEATAPLHAEASAQAVPAEQAPASGEPFAFLSLEVRRLSRPGTPIEGHVAGRILNRCVLSALEALAKERVPVDLGGTRHRPVIEATFPGADGALQAAAAGITARDAVRRVQREAENEFHIVGAITSGTTNELENGVKIVTGSPRQVAARFREHAAPGQILVAEEAWGSCRDGVDVAHPAVLVTIPGSEPVPSYPLSALKR